MSLTSKNTFDHCLYPVFTQSIVKRLKERTSINLIGKVENGRSRILEDIQKCDLEEVKVVLVNMKVYRKNYQGFIEELNQQMGFKGKTAPKDLADWMNKITAKKQRVFLFLDCFDDLLNTKKIDAKYRTRTFVHQINSLKNHSCISLICGTAKSHKFFLFYIGSKHEPSPFLLENRLTPSALSHEKVNRELERQLNGSVYWENIKANEDGKRCIAAIQNHPEPYPFLVHVADSIQTIGNEKPVIHELLSRWEKEYKGSKKISWIKRFIKRKDEIMETWLIVKPQNPPENIQVNAVSSSIGKKKNPIWIVLFLVASIAFIYFVVQANFFASATSIVLAVTFLNQTLGFLNQLFKK